MSAGPEYSLFPSASFSSRFRFSENLRNPFRLALLVDCKITLRAALRCPSVNLHQLTVRSVGTTSAGLAFHQNFVLFHLDTSRQIA
jgi:hypothetical protein